MKAPRRLDEVCDVLMGQAPSGAAYNVDGEGWPLIAGAGDFGSEYPVAKKFTTEASKLSEPGDIVLGIRASIGEKVLSDGIYCLGRGVAGLRARPELNTRYLWHWLDHAGPELASKAKGATFKQVNRADIGGLMILLPSASEQRRIADLLDRAEWLRAKRRAALAQLDTLAQAIFLEMFGDPTGNPKGWRCSHVGEVADVQGGLQVSAARHDAPRAVPYLRVANVYRGRLDLTEVKNLRASEAEIARTLLIEGDLLVVEGHGNPDEIGRCAIWNGSIPECVHQNHIIRVRLRQDAAIPVYAQEYLNSPGGRRHLLRAGKTTTGLNTISVSEVRAAPLTLPPLSVQHNFARRLAAVDKLKAAQRASLAQLDLLFASLQHRAFRGEL